MRIGMVGLGRMGLNMTRRLVEGGHEVVGYSRGPEQIDEAVRAGAEGAHGLAEMVEKLTSPRVIWLMIPAGSPVDDVIEELKELCSEDDIIIDGGNSYYKDAIRRTGALRKEGIRFADVGVSGGIWGLELGYCLMAGCEKDVFSTIEPLFKTLAPADGYLHCGPAGAGHFLKMVHNGIEYAMMEAYAEGFELLDASPYGSGLKYSEVSKLWNRGSVIRSWLLDLLENAFRKDANLTAITGFVEDSGEGRWTVKEAVDLGVSAPVITDSLFRRFRSRQEDSFAERVLAALRREFGGHAVRGNT